MVCKPGSVPARRRAFDGHSSGTSVAGRLARPTRAVARKPAFRDKAPKYRPYLVLLPVGFTLPPLLPGARCALTAPFHPYHPLSEGAGGGLFSVALSLGSPPPGVTRHRLPVEPGLSSPRHRVASAPKGGHPTIWPTLHTVREKLVNHRHEPGQATRAVAVADAVAPGGAEMALEGGQRAAGGGIVAVAAQHRRYLVDVALARVRP